MGVDNHSINVIVMQSNSIEKELDMHGGNKFPINIDDTIDQIKRKIFIALTEDSEAVPITAMYLMCKRNMQLSTIGIYDLLSRNGKIVITADRALSYLSNIDDLDTSSLTRKEEITYDDLLALNIDNRTFTVSVPLGQRFVTSDNYFPFTANPFKVYKYDPLLESSASDITTTTNSSSLLDVTEMLPTIYMIPCNSCLEYAISNGLSESSTIKIYYPLLGYDELMFKKEKKTEPIKLNIINKEPDIKIEKVYEEKLINQKKEHNDRLSKLIKLMTEKMEKYTEKIKDVNK